MQSLSLLSFYYCGGTDPKSSKYPNNLITAIWNEYYKENKQETEMEKNKSEPILDSLIRTDLSEEVIFKLRIKEKELDLGSEGKNLL